MRKISWSPQAIRDYSNIIDYLTLVWSENELLKFNNKVIAAISILKQGNFDAVKLGYKDFNKMVIQKQVSIIYRVKNNEIEIIRIWDNRQNPKKLFQK